MKKEAEEESKLCSRCGKSKPLSEFNKDRTKKSGYHNRCKECTREYYKDHKEEKCEYDREYRKKHREEKCEHAREYYKNHRKERCGYSRKYQQTEAGQLSDKIRAQRRRARKAAANGDGITKEQWLSILNAQKNKCNVCGKRFCKSRKPSMDHIIPISKGGSHDASNIQALCKSCNSSKSNKIQKGLIHTWLT